MLLIEIALAFLIAWSICERWVFPRYKKQDPPEPRGRRAEVIYMNACHAESAYKHDSEARRKAENRRRFLRELEDFCLYEGLDLKVWEDFEFDALGIRLHDRKTSRTVQARVEKEKYENYPLLSAGRIIRTWGGETYEHTEETD